MHTPTSQQTSSKFHFVAYYLHKVALIWTDLCLLQCTTVHWKKTRWPRLGLYLRSLWSASCLFWSLTHPLSYSYKKSSPFYLLLQYEGVLGAFKSLHVYNESKDIRNLTIFNIIHWVTGSMGQSSHWPSVWCSKYYFFV